MRPYALLTVLAMACARPNDVSETEPLPDPQFPAEWVADTPDPPEPPLHQAARLTLLTDAGPLTFDLRDGTGRPIVATAAVAFDEDEDGAEELYLSAEGSRFRFDIDTHIVGEPVPWVDGEGRPWVPDALASGMVAGLPVLVGTRGSELRLWDVETRQFALTAPMVVLPDPEAEPGPFQPRSLSLVHLSGPTLGTFLGLDPDGGMYVEGTPLSFAPYLVPPETCDEGLPLVPQALVVASLEQPTGPVGETILLVADGAPHPVGSSLRCFRDPEPVFDHGDVEVHVDFGTVWTSTAMAPTPWSGGIDETGRLALPRRLCDAADRRRRRLRARSDLRARRRSERGRGTAASAHAGSVRQYTPGLVRDRRRRPGTARPRRAGGDVCEQPDGPGQSGDHRAVPVGSRAGGRRGRRAVAGRMQPASRRRA